jgi:hypothetical protein
VFLAKTGHQPAGPRGLPLRLGGLVRADLRARAERAERQADAYRDELAELRAETSQGTTIGSKTPRRAVQAAQP